MLLFHRRQLSTFLCSFFGIELHILTDPDSKMDHVVVAMTDEDFLMMVKELRDPQPYMALKIVQSKRKLINFNTINLYIYSFCIQKLNNPNARPFATSGRKVTVFRMVLI